jgi:hypothetical protein
MVVPVNALTQILIKQEGSLLTWGSKLTSSVCIFRDYECLTLKLFLLY